MRERDRLSPSGLPWPPGWPRRRMRGRARSAAFAALGVVLLGFAGLIWTGQTAPGDAHLALALLLFGLGVFGISFIAWTGSSRSAVFRGILEDGDERHCGAVFPLRRGGRPVMAAAVALFGAGSLTMFLAPEGDVGGDPILLAIGVGLVIVSVLVAAAGGGFLGIVLTPEHVLVRTSPGSSDLLAWEDVWYVMEYEVVGDLLIGLVPHDPDVLGTGSRARWRTALGIGGRGIEIPAARFVADPALLLLALRHYHAHPAHRPELATREAVDRIKAADLPG